MNKSQRVFLKELSKEIDKIYVSQLGRKMTYTTIQPTKVSHEDMELVNQEYEEDKEYTFNMPIFHEVNHFRRLKRSLHKYGSDGVIDYLKKCGFTPDRTLITNALTF